MRTFPTNIENLAGLSPVEFSEALIPIREYLESFDPDKELATMMTVDNITHHKAGDTYVREMLIPEGMLLLGRVHKRPLVNILSKGRTVIIDSNGKHTYVAPCTWVSQAGTQRLMFCPEETILNTAHVSKAECAEDFWDDLTVDNYEEYLRIEYQLTKQE